MTDDIQQSVYKLIASVDSLKENVELQIGYLNEKIDNQSKLFEKISRGIDEMGEKVEQHDDDIRDIKNELAGLKQLKLDIDVLKQDILDLKLKPTKDKSGFIDRCVGVIENVVFTAFAGGVIAFIIYLVKGWFLSK